MAECFYRIHYEHVASFWTSSQLIVNFRIQREGMWRGVLFFCESTKPPYNVKPQCLQCELSDIDIIQQL